MRKIRRSYRKEPFLSVHVPVGFFLGLLLVSGLTGCQNRQSQLPDLSSLGAVAVISREEGSGTRSEFESLIKTAGKGTGQIAISTEEMLVKIQEEPNSVGYLALSAMPEDAKGKILSVNDVYPNEDTVGDGTYPLCRNYYLAYSGELEEAEMDFMKYIRSAGQELVKESCIPVKKAATFLSDQASGSIVISGSSSVGPLMERLAADYQTYNPNVEITVQITDSSAGLTAAIRGECDLAMSSRRLKDYEAELLETEAIASDAMAVVVNDGNPLETLTVKQLKQIYDGDCRQWMDLK